MKAEDRFLIIYHNITRTTPFTVGGIKEKDKGTHQVTKDCCILECGSRAI